MRSSSYLKAALATHLLYLAWSDEGWRDFINDFETSIRTIVGPAKTALVDDHIDPNSSQFEVWPGALQGKRRQRTMSYRLSRGNTGITSNHSNKVAPTSVKDRMVSFGRDLFGRLKETKPDEEQGVSSPAVQYNHSSGLDPSGSLDKLRVKDIQTLYS
ncbi:hypothetical protein CGMCC3_g1119 [Colletotrichum fructicola]|nr:uncharacterized protein CGMCC3_g1119 [Colletotrichum fructicola]KAE9583108.1 hypothetical protein CGMCC3_g1119 [Colletotrichum fructicola]